MEVTELGDAVHLAEVNQDSSLGGYGSAVEVSARAVRYDGHKLLIGKFDYLLDFLQVFRCNHVGWLPGWGKALVA